MQFDIPHHIGAITRAVVAGEREGQPTRTIRAGRSFRTGIEDTWDALTSEARIPRWFSPVTGDFRLGGRFQIQGNAAGTVEECEPPRQLAITWEFGGGTSWVVVDLTEEPGGTTRLELQHIGIVEPNFEKFWDQYGSGAGGVGWDLSLLGLAEHLEHGWDKPPETDTEWVQTDDYKQFVRGSSEGWRDASIAFGLDAQAAGEASDRTTEFYGG